MIWGGLHGIYAAMSKLTLPARDRLVTRLRTSKIIVQSVRIFVTFQLVCFGWIYFRSASLDQANFIVSQIFPLPWGDLFITALDQFSYGIAAIVMLLAVDVSQEWFQLSNYFALKPWTVRWASYVAIIVVMLLTGVFDESQFIYFQF